MVYYYLSIGIVIGYVAKVIFSDSEVRRLRRINKALISHRDELDERLKESDRLYRKKCNALLDLRRRYDKVYTNDYRKFK